MSIHFTKSSFSFVFLALLLRQMPAWAGPDLPTILGLGLPVVDIVTRNGEEPTCDIVEHPEGCMGQGITNMNKVKGRLLIRQGYATLYDSGDYEKDVSGMTIRVRGNSSAWRDKKPYKIKLQKKADLLMRGDDQRYKDKDWLLIKDERVSLNTIVGLKVNELLGMQWTPRYRIVNVMLNGVYRGLYLLIESVKRNGDCRLNVDKQTGYVFEYDPYWWNEDLYFETRFTASPDAKFTFKDPDPEDVTVEQVAYLKGMMDQVETSLATSDYRAYIDLDSFAAWLLGQDILGNYDGHGSNIYMTKYDNTPRSKVMMANLWDFDAIMMTPGRWSNSHRILYFGTLLDHADGQFTAAYKAKWNRVKGTLFADVIRFLTEFEASETGQAYDRSIPYDSYRCNRTGESLRKLTADACEWFVTRREWLEETLRDPAGVEAVEVEEEADDAPYYGLDGVRHPGKPRKGVYIHRGRKVIVR